MPMHRLRPLPILLVSLAALAGGSPSRAGEFPLKEGDVWVMAGDSITAQKQHSNYFEAFCYARYPRLRFAFRNSGVGGHTIPSTLARFDYDIADWKPTVVSVELGMNDKGGTPTDKFIANMATMVERIRSIKARPVILAASPVNDGSTLAKMTPGNQRLHEYAAALKEFADKQMIPFADQFHPLLDVWGKNKPNELVANSMATVRQLAQNNAIAGVEHLREFLAAQDKLPVKPLSMMGDPVHPGATGQLMMAAALLKGLGTDGFVSSATLDASGKVVEAKGCTVDEARAADGKLAFDRLDECSPFPIPDEARPILAFDPTILGLSQYTLKVTGLKDGDYLLKIDGAPVARVSAKDLESGMNLTSYGSDPKAKQANPIAAQGKAVLAAVAAKEGLVNGWRGLSKMAHDPIPADAKEKLAAEYKEKLAAQLKKVEAADAKIREAAKPRKLHFELSPAAG
jgi:lysophospholipase L1-like esterase